MRFCFYVLAITVVLFLPGCGGGGSATAIDATSSAGTGSGSIAAVSATRAPLPELVQDIEPAGALIASRGAVYFPATLGDTWSYSASENGVPQPIVLRSVSVSVADAFTIRSVQLGVDAAPELRDYRRSANGHVTVVPVSGVPPAAQSLIGSLIEFPDPFRPVGALRVSIRQGNWGADIDGDGVDESFRLEVRQAFAGTDLMTLPVGTAATLHFRNTMVLTISPSRLTGQPITFSETEDSWWAANVGLVRRDKMTSKADGTFVISLLRILGGVVGGVALFPVTR